MDVPPLTTSRLLLEPLRPEHAAELFSIYSDTATMRFWHSLAHTGVEDTERLVRGELAHQAAPAWAVRLRDDGTLLGRVDFIAAAITGMGYMFGSPHWGKGYASEAAAAALEYGFRSAGYNRVELWIHEHNLASQRLAARLGFRRRGQFRQRYEHHATPFETQVWGLRAGEWAAAGAQASAREPRRATAFYGVAPTLTVADVAATASYYVEHLGFDLDYCDGVPMRFAIVGRGEWTSERAQLHIVHGAATQLPQRLYLRVSDADALHDEWRARGVAIEQPPLTQPYGRRELAVRDPNGLLLVFAADV